MKKRSRSQITGGDGADSSDEEVAKELVAAGLVQASSGVGQYKTERLLQCYDEIKRDLPWIETLDVCAPEDVALENPDDDLKREVAFYNIALGSVKVARAKLDTLGEAHKRPDDYFAEMLKTDT